MELIAHRGASFDAPENSLEAFDLAIRQGATRLELDIQLTKDDVPVVNHDDTTERTADRTMVVEYVKSDELREARLDNGEPIPLFKEVCELVRGRAELDVELKATRPEVAENILQILADHDLLKHALITSFDAEVLRLIRKLGFRGRSGLVVGSSSLNPRQRRYEAWPFERFEYAQATDLVMHHRLALWHIRREVKRRNAHLVLWMSMDDERREPAKREAWYQRMHRLEPDGVILGRIAEAREVFETMERKALPAAEDNDDERALT